MADVNLMVLFSSLLAVVSFILLCLMAFVTYRVFKLIQFNDKLLLSMLINLDLTLAGNLFLSFLSQPKCYCLSSLQLKARVLPMTIASQ